MRSVLLLLLIYLAIPGTVTADSLIFISIKGEQRLAAYRLDEESGQLTHLADTRTKGEPGNLTCDAAKGLLFVAMRSTGELASFRIDRATGKLTLLAQVPGGDDPAQISLDQSRRFLLTAYYVAAKVTVHAIADDGRLSPRRCNRSRPRKTPTPSSRIRAIASFSCRTRGPTPFSSSASTRRRAS